MWKNISKQINKTHIMYIAGLNTNVKLNTNVESRPYIITLNIDIVHRSVQIYLII